MCLPLLTAAYHSIKAPWRTYVPTSVSIKTLPAARKQKAFSRAHTHHETPATSSTPLDGQLLDEQLDLAHDGVLVDNDDTPSETSTVAWDHTDHEPFETFKVKVYQLAHQLFPTAGKIEVEHMKGGQYNRTVGITIFPPRTRTRTRMLPHIRARIRKLFGPKIPEECEKFVLRIPRFHSQQLDQQVAVLNVLASKLSLPTSTVIKYDISSDNILGRQYMIQTRLPGQNLCRMLESLNVEQQESLAKGVMQVNQTIASFESPSAGEISTANLSCSPHSRVHVEKFHIPRHGELDTTSPSLPQSPLTALLEMCERWREVQRASGICWEHFWNGFSVIIRSLDRQGFLDGQFALTHGDLQAYNLLAVVKDETTVEITGVIDWDSAVFAPKFEAYRAPSWTWLGTDVNSENYDDEMLATYEPKGETEKRLKAVFVDGASEEWKKYAFAPEAILARRMFAILKSGLYFERKYNEAASILKEWSDIHPEDHISLEEDFGDCDSIESVSEYDDVEEDYETDIEEDNEVDDEVNNKPDNEVDNEVRNEPDNEPDKLS